MKAELVKKLKDFADKKHLVMRVFCDNAMVYHYNAQHKNVTFDFTNELFYGFNINCTTTGTGLPIAMDIVEFEMIQGIRLEIANSHVEGAILDLGIPDLQASTITDMIGDDFNRFNFGKNPYLYGNESPKAEEIRQSVAVPKESK